MSDDPMTKHSTPRWRSVATDPPPERTVVEVKNNGGARLQLDRGLWWFEDHSMYVYYSPEWWRPLDGIS